MLLKNLQSKQLIHPPPWLPDTTQYLCIMGSVAYGVSSDTSDCDLYGWCVPPKEMIFPHLSGEIIGFGRQIKRFDNWQEHHIEDKDARKQYDFSIYNIVRFFQLCMENNPNMLDALFVPQHCVIHSTAIANLVRENRKIFVHKGCFHKFKGYSFSQLHKMSTKNPTVNAKRVESVEKYGYDTKFAYHVARLMLECEMLLNTHDMDLEANREVLKSIRRGEWTEEQIRNYFTTYEPILQKAYENSTLPYIPDEDKIKKLLLECLEHHFGTLENVYHEPDRYKNGLLEIQAICDKLKLHV